MENMEPMMMKKKSNTGIIVTVIVLAVITIGAFAFSGPSQQDKMMMAEKEAMEQKVMMEKEAMMKDSDSMMQKDEMKKEGTMMENDSIMMTKGSYEVYSPEKLAWAKDGKVVLFFKASWCPSCKAVDADIKANLSSIPEGTHILEVDYDKSVDLKKKYGVTYQHTFVQVDTTGAQLTKWSGSSTLASLLTNIK